MEVAREKFHGVPIYSVKDLWLKIALNKLCVQHLCSMQCVTTTMVGFRQETISWGQELMRSVPSNTVDFNQTHSSCGPADIYCPRTLAIQALRNIYVARSCTVTTVIPIV